MMTGYGESSVDNSYPSIWTPQSSAGDTPLERSPVEDEQFQGVAQLLRSMEAHVEKLQGGATYQDFLIFHPVKETDIAKIDRFCKRIGKSSRVGYDRDTERLIIKLMPNAKHQSALTLGYDLFNHVVCMGLRREFRYCGGTRYSCSGSFKEADSAFRPSSRNQTEWPTIVFEVGYSESIGQLRLDAMWWLNMQTGVNIVMLITIDCRPSTRCLTIEKWGRGLAHPQRMPLTSSMTVPEKKHQIIVDLDQDIVIGAPLILEFEQIFLRPAVPPRETDIQFSENDLLELATDLWGNR